MVDICRVKMTRSLPVTLGLKSLTFSRRSFGFSLMVWFFDAHALELRAAPGLVDGLDFSFASFTKAVFSFQT